MCVSLRKEYILNETFMQGVTLFSVLAVLVQVMWWMKH